jgi:rRNA biogenesis protein RRP5
VMLSRSVTARVGISQLSDRYIQDVKGGFPPGKLVHGRILSVDTAKGLVDMSLKRSVVLAKKRVLYTDLEVGQIVKGHVKSIQAFGIFVRIKDSELDGLCHISEVTSEYVKDLGKLYSSGDKVKAKIIKLDKTKKTISLGMKESHFEGVEDEDDDDDSDAEGPGGKVQDSGSEGMSDDDDDDDGMDEDDGEDDDQDDEDDDDDDDDDDDEDVEMSGIGGKKVKKGGNAMEMDSDESESESGDDDDDGIGKTTTAGFEWDGFGSKANQEEDSDDSDNDEDDEEEMDGESAASKSKEKRRKKREKERAEALTREKEAALLDPERAPETAEEFERLVVSSPNRCRLSTLHYSLPFISSAILATLCSFPLFLSTFVRKFVRVCAQQHRPG